MNIFVIQCGFFFVISVLKGILYFTDISVLIRICIKCRSFLLFWTEFYICKFVLSLKPSKTTLGLKIAKRCKCWTICNESDELFDLGHVYPSHTPHPSSHVSLSHAYRYILGSFSPDEDVLTEMLMPAAAVVLSRAAVFQIYSLEQSCAAVALKPYPRPSLPPPHHRAVIWITI